MLERALPGRMRPAPALARGDALRALWEAASACGRCSPMPPASSRRRIPSVVDAVAAAVELIHAYSLVHDDLPCMDDDVLRRGKPTCHVEFGEATALLAGDALQALAFAVLGSAPHAAMPGAACALLAHAAGARGMAGGQAIDLAAVGQAARAARARDHAPAQDRRADPRRGAARRALRARRSTPLRTRALDALRRCGRPRLPGRRRRARRRRLGRDARQDRGQGRRAATSRLT